ncbi:MAG TPA: NRDE family protein [Chitinophagales bacterium]|nr:NRDE family protein [Chitinophagales bacterium]HRG85270.1 NRDE family protein [Chitinophagales bacterium]HRH52324.1 NRDE family protein [Chitinophagales bacterium]
MCLINLAFRQHPSYPLILVANRDEFYARPTRILQWWEDEHPDLLAGKDLQEGGTWMGINKQGQFAALTNYRDLSNINNNAPSRGLIVKRYLNGELPDEEMFRFLKTQGKLYNGFNIIYGNVDMLYYYSNVTDQVRNLYPGIYGLSNALLDTPWPKLVNSKTQFTQTLNQTTESSDFIPILQNPELAPDNLLPQTGVSFEWEKKLSAMFITSPDYGTRLTTFVRIDNNGNVTYREKGYVPEHDITINFTVQPNS